MPILTLEHYTNNIKDIFLIISYHIIGVQNLMYNNVKEKKKKQCVHLIAKYE